jgi:hypothetical protein
MCKEWEYPCCHCPLNNHILLLVSSCSFKRFTTLEVTQTKEINIAILVTWISIPPLPFNYRYLAMFAQKKCFYLIAPNKAWGCERFGISTICINFMLMIIFMSMPNFIHMANCIMHLCVQMHMWMLLVLPLQCSNSDDNGMFQCMLMFFMEITTLSVTSMASSNYSFIHLPLKHAILNWFYVFLIFWILVSVRWGRTACP